MSRGKLIALAAGVGVSVVLGAASLWWRLPSAESEVDAYLGRRDVPADATDCVQLRYDSDPYAYRCAIAAAGRVRIDGWEVPRGAGFCFSVPGAHRRFGGDPIPYAPDGTGRDCITRALGG